MFGIARSRRNSSAEGSGWRAGGRLLTVVALVAGVSIAVAGPAAAAVNTFSTTTDITIPAGTVGTGGVSTPYPGTVAVSGLTGTISDINLRLDGLSHQNPGDIDLMLVSPAGQNLVVMSDAGEATTAFVPISNLTLTLDDEAAAQLPATGQITAGTFRPSNFVFGGADTFPGPAPAPSAATQLAAFDGSNPNGTWSLYIVDDSGGETGVLSGWSLVVTTADAAVPGRLQFGAANTLTFEGAGTAPVTVTRTNGSDGPVAATVTSSNGTATAGSDFTAVSQTVSFAAGQTSATVNVPITDDGADEGINETLNLTLSAPTGGAALGTPITHTVAIEDNDSRSNRTAIAIPGPGTVGGVAGYYPSRIRTQGVTGTVTDLNVTLTGLTHTHPEDIDVLLVAPDGKKAVILSDAGGATPVSNTTLVLDDEAGGPVPTPIVSGTFTPTDIASPGADTFPAPAPAPAAGTLAAFDGANPNGVWSLYVVDDSGGNTGTLAQGWTLTIDTAVAPVPGRLQFEAASTLTFEGAGTAPVTVTRTNGSDGPVAATVTSSGGTATAGSDYTAVSQTVSFAAGQTSATVNVPITDDGADEGINETLNLTLSAPTGGATLGTPTTHTVAIEDNDSRSNRTAIAIPGPGTVGGVADYYPSRIRTQGLTGPVTDLNVTLTGLTHTSPQDIDILVVAPDGKNAVVLANAGGFDDVSGVTLTLDDQAAGPVPTPMTSGTFRPTNAPNGTLDGFPPPAPTPAGTALAAFDGANPNGIWTMYVVDNAGGDVGTLAGGWTLTLDTNAAPVAVDDAYTTAAGTPLTVDAPGVLTNDTDAENNTLTAAVVATTTNGTTTLNADGSFTYTPNAGFTGDDTFTYQASDGTNPSNTATVTITVTAPPNAAPVAVDDAYSTAAGTALTVDAPGVLTNDTDAEGDPLTATLGTGPTNGTLTFNLNGSFTYTPNAGFTGDDTFTYQASDGTNPSNTATVTITVTAPPNATPVAVDDAYTTAAGTPLTVDAPGVLANDTDAESNPETAAVVATSTNGTTTLNTDGSFTYTPDAGFTGPDTFTYQASDGTTPSNTATVTVTVTAPQAAPSCATATPTITSNARVVNGTPGADVIFGGPANQRINGGGGNDTICGGGGNDTIDGGAGNDHLDGQAGNDAPNGGDGDDVVNGGVGNDIVNGGAGNDTLDGQAGQDIVIGGEGDDTERGGVGNDVVGSGTTDPGADQLFGDGGSDRCLGTAGTDVIDASCERTS